MGADSPALRFPIEQVNKGKGVGEESSVPCGGLRHLGVEEAEKAGSGSTGLHKYGSRALPSWTLFYRHMWVKLAVQEPQGIFKTGVAMLVLSRDVLFRSRKEAFPRQATQSSP